MSKMNNDEVGHAWYYGDSTDFRTYGAENFYYAGDTIYSHGSHYPIARKCDDFILFTVDGSGMPMTSSYGSTTARHVSIARGAIPRKHIIIFVENPKAATKQEHLGNYQSEMDRIAGILKLISKGRNGTVAQQRRLDSIYIIAGGMNLYTKAYKLGKRQLSVESLLDPTTLEKIKADETKLAKKRVKEELQRQTRLEQDNLERIEEWKLGVASHIPSTVTKVYLRQHNDVIQTSKGAELPINQAKKLFSYVKAVVAGKLEFKKCHVGPFELLHITSEEVVVGCHTIKIAEMERINALL